MSEKISKDISVNKKRYEAFFMATRDAVMTLESPSWKFTSANPATIKLFKAKDEAEFLLYGPDKLSPEIQPDGRPSVDKAKAMIEQAIREGNNLFEWVHKKINGEEFFAEVLLSRVEQDDNIFLLASVRDITERKKLEAQFIKKQQEQQLILDTIPAWVFYKDDKNNFIRVNKSFCEAMGLSKEQLEGKSLFNIFPKAQAEAFLKDDKEVIASKNPKKGIIESVDSPKGAIWVETDKIPYLDESGNIIGIIGFTIDITERRLAEDEVAKHNQELEKLNKLMIGRELEMINLKKEIAELKREK